MKTINIKDRKNAQKIGIDLGSSMIKIVTIDDSSGGIAVKESAVFPAVGQVGDRIYFESLKNNIKLFTQHYNYEYIDISFTISPFIEGVTTVQFLDMPTSDEKILKKGVKFEITEQELVDDIANHHYEWNVVESEEENLLTEEEVDTSRVLLTTVSRNVLYEIAQLRTLKWSVSNIELQVDSYGRFIKGSSAVIDFGHASASIYLFKDGEIKEIEKIDFGGRQINQIIHEALDTPSIEVAEELKQKATLNNLSGESKDDNQEQLIYQASQTLTDEMVEAVSEIKRIIRGFELKDPMNPVELEQIYYTGGGSKSEGFLELFKDSFEYEITPLLDSFEKTSEQPNETNHFVRSKQRMESESTSNKDKKETTNRFTAKTLELTQKVKEYLKIEDADVLEEELSEKNEEKDLYFYPAISAQLFQETTEFKTHNYVSYLKYKLDYTSVLFMVTALSVTLMLGTSFVSNSYEKSISELNTAISSQGVEAGKLNEEQSKLDSKLKENKELSERVDSLKDQKQWSSEILFEIPTITPSGIIIQELTMNGPGKVEIKGDSTDYTDIGAFVMGLESLGTAEIESIKDDENSTKYPNDGLITDKQKGGQNTELSFVIKLNKDAKID